MKRLLILTALQLSIQLTYAANSSPEKIDAYQKILGVEQGATEKEINAKFRKLALQWSPDKNLNNQGEATKKLQEINEAHTELLKALKPSEEETPSQEIQELLAQYSELKEKIQKYYPAEAERFATISHFLRPPYQATPTPEQLTQWKKELNDLESKINKREEREKHEAQFKPLIDMLFKNYYSASAAQFFASAFKLNQLVMDTHSLYADYATIEKQMADIMKNIDDVTKFMQQCQEFSAKANLSAQQKQHIKELITQVKKSESVTSEDKKTLAALHEEYATKSDSVTKICD